MVIRYGQHDRSELVEGVNRVDVRATVEQELDHLDVAAVGCKEQGRRLVAIAGIDVGAGVEGLGDARGIPRAGGRPQFFV